ncbi:response regulator transcription factor [Pontibacter sp. Tf4]|uniref:LytR/AlgR family response regulator transcription factor n=1 Tax=Pontibacter sp. Tf4 TaxID=2761620 RepID=UPI00162AD21D|nr:LytTR family DNA-binding domain-containing protein [Pontibacter sp. Tf4]MBB6611766.1 response regulator transcription factor [Pontibacter sp. Tf4]
MNETHQYRCVVIDDESHAVELLSDYIESVPQLQLAGTYQDPVRALMDFHGDIMYDFIFLDIDMPRISGIELAKTLRSHAAFLIFTTAHSKYALEAFDVQADHFLLKPISFNKFLAAVKCVFKRQSGSHPAIPQQTDEGFFIKSDKKSRLIRVRTGEIIAVEGLKNYVIIHTASHKHITYLTMKEVEEALSPSNGFIRVHRSFIIAKKSVEQIEGSTITLVNNLEVPIGDTYRQQFLQYVTGNVLISGRLGSAGN